jgi:hypothetical protein
VPWIVVALIVAFLAFSGGGNPVVGAVTLLNEIVRGKRLTFAAADSAGLVETAPQDLADQVGASLEAYSAARMIASENPHEDNTTKAAICWCLINEAARRSSSITDLLTKAKNPKNDGSYGSQEDKDPTSANYKHSDRYASTAEDPYQGELDIVNGCMSGAFPDLTDGCTNFDDLDAFKTQAKADTHAANNIASGLTLASVDGTSSKLRFWRPV